MKMIQKRLLLLSSFFTTACSPTERTVRRAGAESVRRAPGVFDRLLADGYSHAGLETLTLDRQMVSLPSVRRL